MTEFKTKLIRISSADRTTGDENEFKISLGQNSLNPNIRAVKLVSASFYNLFYNIRTGVNDTFSFQEAAQGRSDVTLIAGFYTITDLFTALKAQIDPLLVAGFVTLTLQPYSNLIKIDFTGTTASVIVDATATISRSIGYDSTSATAASHLAGSIPKLGGLDEVFVRCDELAAQKMIDAADSSHRGVFAVLPNVAVFGGQNYWESDSNDTMVTFGSPRRLNTLTFRMENSQKELLDMQKQHIKFILKIYY